MMQEHGKKRRRKEGRKQDREIYTQSQLVVDPLHFVTICNIEVDGKIRW